MVAAPISVASMFTTGLVAAHTILAKAKTSFDWLVKSGSKFDRISVTLMLLIKLARDDRNGDEY